MQLSSLLICEIIIVMCFNIVDLNYFPSNYICKGLVCFYISINRYDFVIFYLISFLFCFSINIILLLLILLLYSFAVQALTLFPRCFFVIFRSFFWFRSLCSVGVQKLFSSVNEHITQ